MNSRRKNVTQPGTIPCCLICSALIKNLCNMPKLPKNEVLALFDVDGTLTPSRLPISSHIEEFMEKRLKPNVSVGLVSGSDLKKVAEQMRGTPEEVVGRFDFVFSENGLVAHKTHALTQ